MVRSRFCFCMLDVDATIEARAVLVSTFGKYDALAAPPSQGALGGGYGTAFGVRFARMLTPFVGFEQGYLACSGCSSKASSDNLFFGVRYETPNDGAFRFRVELDLGYRSVRASNAQYALAGPSIYGPGATGSAWRWSGFEPRLSVGPTFRLGSLVALDLSLTGALGSFSRVEWSGVIATAGTQVSQSSASIEGDASRVHAFVGLTLGARALLPIHRE